MSFHGHFIYSGAFIQLSFPHQGSTKLFESAIFQPVDFYKVFTSDWSLELINGAHFTAEKTSTGHAILKTHQNDVWVPITSSFGYQIIRSLVTYTYEGSVFVNTHIDKELR